jgi:hypothetical protein
VVSQKKKETSLDIRLPNHSPARLRPRLRERLDPWSPASRCTYSPIPVPETRQLFIGVHSETLSVVAMRVCNPDYSPIGINR